MTADDLRRGVAEALEGLDIPEADRWKIPIYTSLLSIRLSVVQGGPLLRVGTKKGAIRELRQLHRALLSLEDALSSLSLTATSQLEVARDDLGLKWAVSIPQPIRLWLVDNYPGLADATRNAERALENAHATRGRSADAELQRLCRELIDTYFKLTKCKPTRGDDTYDRAPPFFGFVKAIFDSAGLRASAEHYTRWAVEDFVRRTTTAELIRQKS